MRNLKLTLEYDGTDFSGFQLQPKRPTIQEALETALSKFFNRPTKIGSASGRTDAGVHAECQVVHVKVNHSAPAAQIQRGLNAYLPPSIAIKKIEDVNLKFHARFKARNKTYEYRVWNDPVRSPFQEREAFHVSQPLQLAAMRKAARIFVGRHDFRSFCAAGKTEDKKKDTRRTVKKFIIKREGSLLRFQVTADGFLYHMVRNMAGALLDVGRGRLTPSEVRKVLDLKDRRKASATAPAKALRLFDVTY